jgi:hypothetical protein
MRILEASKLLLAVATTYRLSVTIFVTDLGTSARADTRMRSRLGPGRSGMQRRARH